MDDSQINNTLNNNEHIESFSSICHQSNGSTTRAQNLPVMENLQPSTPNIHQQLHVATHRFPIETECNVQNRCVPNNVSNPQSFMMIGDISISEGSPKDTSEPEESDRQLNVQSKSPVNDHLQDFSSDSHVGYSLSAMNQNNGLPRYVEGEANGSNQYDPVSIKFFGRTINEMQRTATHKNKPTNNGGFLKRLNSKAPSNVPDPKQSPSMKSIDSNLKKFQTGNIETQTEMKPERQIFAQSGHQSAFSNQLLLNKEEDIQNQNMKNNKFQSSNRSDAYKIEEEDKEEKNSKRFSDGDSFEDPRAYKKPKQLLQLKSMKNRETKQMSELEAIKILKQSETLQRLVNQSSASTNQRFAHNEIYSRKKSKKYDVPSEFRDTSKMEEEENGDDEQEPEILFGGPTRESLVSKGSNKRIALANVTKSNGASQSNNHMPSTKSFFQSQTAVNIGGNANPRQSQSHQAVMISSGRFQNQNQQSSNQLDDSPARLPKTNTNVYNKKKSFFKHGTEDQGLPPKNFLNIFQPSLGPQTPNSNKMIQEEVSNFSRGPVSSISAMGGGTTQNKFSAGNYFSRLKNKVSIFNSTIKGDPPTEKKKEEEKKEEKHEEEKPLQSKPTTQHADNDHYLKRKAEVRKLKKDLGLLDSDDDDEDLEDMQIDQENVKERQREANLFKQQGKKIQKWYLIYPHFKFNKVWDLIMTALIILTCLVTPYSMAFPETYSANLFAYDVVMNLMFLLDIIYNFFSAYYDSDFQLVDDFKGIAKHYVSGWFFLDLISVIPLDMIYEYGNFSKIIRFTKIGKIYKLVRITKMVRLLQTPKLRSKFSSYIISLLKIGAGLERLLSLLVTFLLLQHVAACIWILIGRYNEDESTKNWIFYKNFQNDSEYDLYVSSLYFTVTTIVTVGYGDICAQNAAEKCYCIFLMLIGVMSFSFTTGALSSIIASYDSRESALKEKMNTLQGIQKDYKIDHEMFNELSRTVQYNHRKKSKDLISFMEELPHKLKLELAMVIHQKLYSGVLFFQKKERSFIAWISTLLRPINIEDEKYIYKEGEEVTEVYFLVRGAAGYVLPRFENKAYLIIDQGEHFGHVDIASDKSFLSDDISLTKRSHFQLDMMRQFTVQAFSTCDLLQLSISDVFKMKLEFPRYFIELFQKARDRLRKELILKIEVIKQSQLVLANNCQDGASALRSKFAFNLLGGILKQMNGPPGAAGASPADPSKNTDAEGETSASKLNPDGTAPPPNPLAMLAQAIKAHKAKLAAEAAAAAAGLPPPDSAPPVEQPPAEHPQPLEQQQTPEQQPSAELEHIRNRTMQQMQSMPQTNSNHDLNVHTDSSQSPEAKRGTGHKNFSQVLLNVAGNPGARSQPALEKKVSQHNLMSLIKQSRQVTNMDDSVVSEKDDDSNYNDPNYD